MGYGSVILVIGTILIAGVMMLSMDSATSDADEELNEYHYKELARDAATTGLELIVRRLAASNAALSWDATWAAANKFNTTPYSKGGSFRVEIDPVGDDPGEVLPPGVLFGDLVDVIARGFNGVTRDPQTGATKPISQVIYARYLREYADGGIPPAMRNVITADLDLWLRGNAMVLALNNSFNANIHSNGDLRTSGNSFLVEGYGTYTTSESTTAEGNCIIYPGDPNPPDDNFCPNQEYNEVDLNVFWADSVHIPPIDVDGLRNLSQTTSGSYINTPGVLPLIIDGDAIPVIDFTLPGTWPWLGTYDPVCTPGSCGTPDNPFIMFVEGDIDFVNRVEFRGYGNIVATGNVRVIPQGSGGGMFGQLVDDETTLLLATTQNINIGVGGGNACMGLGHSDLTNHCESIDDSYTHGVSLYANGDVTYRGTTYLIGGILVDELSFTGGGTPKIIYASPTEDIIDPGFDFIIPIGPILIGYSEW